MSKERGISPVQDEARLYFEARDENTEIAQYLAYLSAGLQAVKYLVLHQNPNIPFDTFTAMIMVFGGASLAAGIRDHITGMSILRHQSEISDKIDSDIDSKIH